MKRMKVDIKEQIIDLLRDDMEYKEGNKEDGWCSNKKVGEFKNSPTFAI